MPTIEVPYNVNDPDLRYTFYKEVLPKSIDRLDKDTSPQWGKMTSQHMIEHLIFAFQMSTGRLDVECKTLEEERDKLQTFLNINRPMPKGFTNPVTGDQLLDLQYQNLEQAKDSLKQEVQHFLDYYEDHPDATQTNPMFGELEAEQWQKFHFKHCFHHLSQFGLVAEKN